MVDDYSSITGKRIGHGTINSVGLGMRGRLQHCSFTACSIPCDMSLPVAVCWYWQRVSSSSVAIASI